jgi:hypothetical protein
MKFLKRIFGLGMLAAAGYALWRAYVRRRVDTGIAWDPQPFPYPPQPRSEPAGGSHPSERVAAQPTAAPPGSEPEPTHASNGAAWVEPDGGACPATHPVKAKLASGIFHVPGGANYERTNADRCYLTAEAAESDGLRPAKR